jgi:hypothetical protein
MTCLISFSKKVEKTTLYRDKFFIVCGLSMYDFGFSPQAWAPWTEADKACLEKVQQRVV